MSHRCPPFALASIVWLVLLTTGLAFAQQGAFQTLKVDGHAAATYHAVEPHMRVALEQMSDYFLPRKGQAFRVWEDHMMPDDLKELDFAPAGVLMRRWFVEFFKDQDPRTGLVPLGGVSRPSERIFTTEDMSKCMFLCTMQKATPFLVWWPDDPQARERCMKMADGFVKYFRAGRGENFGLFTAVRTDTGFPESALTNVTSYGSVTAGLARIGVTTGRRDFVELAKGIAGWVDDFSMKYCRGIVPEKFHACGGFPNDLSSDGIYWVRALEEAYKLTGDAFYRDLIVKHGNVYFEQGWSEPYQHFSTHVEVDFEGFHPTGTMYGDTKYNYPQLLCLLTRMTDDPKYMRRFDALWATFMREAVNGWVPDALSQGHRLERKGQPPEDKNQSLYLFILLDAWETTKDAKYLKMAGEWAEKLMTPDGKAHWRGDTIGRALIHYARAAGLVSRLEVRFPAAPEGPVQILAADGTTVFSEPIPTPAAVFYLAPGRYTLRAPGCEEAAVELQAEEKKIVSLVK